MALLAGILQNPKTLILVGNVNVPARIDEDVFRLDREAVLWKGAVPLFRVGRHEVRVRWHPFQLNPQMPRGGMDRRAYRTAKFGSWEQSQALDAQVAAVGAAEGLVFAFDKMKRTPFTLDAHRLIRLGGQEGIQDVVVEAMFLAYFTEGRD